MRRELLSAVAAVVSRPLRAHHARDPGAVAEVPATAIVVLGAALDAQDQLQEVGRERVSAAAELWRRGLAPLLVVSGGVTRGAGRTEADAMAEALVALGVPSAAIVREPRALTTADNARYTAALLRDRGHATRVGATVWLVTQPFHGRRARWLFARAGLTPLVWHIADSIEYREPARALRWSLREYLAWTKALLVR